MSAQQARRELACPAVSDRAGSDWSAEEVAELRQLALRRLRAATIAGMLGRSPAAIRGKAANCGIDIVSDRAAAPVTLRRFRTVDPD